MKSKSFILDDYEDDDIVKKELVKQPKPDPEDDDRSAFEADNLDD